MVLSNPLTKEQFEEGHQFLIFADSLLGTLKFAPEQEPTSNTVGTIIKTNQSSWNSYVCNVRKVYKDGFSVYGSHLGKWFSFKIKFAQLIPFNPISKP